MHSSPAAQIHTPNEIVHLNEDDVDEDDANDKVIDIHALYSLHSLRAKTRDKTISLLLLFIAPSRLSFVLSRDDVTIIFSKVVYAVV